MTAHRARWASGLKSPEQHTDAILSPRPQASATFDARVAAADEGAVAEPYAGHIVLFGGYSLEVDSQRLLDHGRPVPIGSRALDLLMLLLERPGELVTKEELVARVWPGTYVDESNLRTQVSAIRRLLKDGEDGRRFVVTIPGRGYRFVGQVTQPDEPERAPVAQHVSHLPSRLTRLVGREAALASLRNRLKQSRLVSIVGPGGVGKTAIALTLAQKLASEFPDGVCFIDLGPLADGSLVGMTLASALGVVTDSKQPTTAILDFLAGRRMLLVLDCCEHVVLGVASLVGTILQSSTDLVVLATSRERLRVAGECVEALAHLPVPSLDESLSAELALKSPAVQLFVERVNQIDSSFALTPENVRTVAEICSHLDGLPLALEMAAGRVEQFGIAGVAAHLDKRLHLLVSGERTALERHQTLRATLDWSYEVLSDDEQAALRRLAVFAGAFSLEAGAAVAGGDASEWQAFDLIAGLVSKSLIVSDFSSQAAQYQLLNTTRAYALEKLLESGEFDAVSRRHAAYLRGLCARDPGALNVRDVAMRQMSNVQAALDWGFSPSGDRDLAVDLVVAVAPYWRKFAMLQEGRARAMQALAALRAAGQLRTMRGARLYESIALIDMMITGVSATTDEAWAQVASIAEAIGDVDYRLKGSWGLMTAHFCRIRLTEALQESSRYRRIAEEAGRTHEIANGDRLIGNVLYMQGDLRGATNQYKRALDVGLRLADPADPLPRQFNQRVTLNTFSALALWSRGFADQAINLIDENVDVARQTGDFTSLIMALAFGACPIALLVKPEAARRHIEHLADITRRHASLAIVARCLAAIFEMRCRDYARGVEDLRDALDRLSPSNYHMAYFWLRAELAEGLLKVGQIEAAERIVNDTLAFAESRGAYGSTPSLRRIEAAVLMEKGAPDLAEPVLVSALALAREQDALGWELPIATDLARLRCSAGRKAEARSLLSGICGRLSEGFDSRDAVAATEFLQRLA